MLVKMEISATEAGAATPFDLGQYSEDEITYIIPADVLHDAVLAWYQVDYDFTTLSGDPQMATTAFYDGGNVHIVIDGLGGPSFYTAKSADLQQSGAVITATVEIETTYDKETGAFLDEPESLSPAIIKLQENTNGTYTLLSFENLPF